MFAILLACLSLVTGDDGAKTSPGEPSDAAAYRAAAEKAGRNAPAHIQLALWCEAHGMNAERLKHLSLAVVYEPTNALARGLMGMVADRGTWGQPEEIGKKIQEDPARRAVIDEYLARRARTPRKADEQAKLALWCEGKGLREQAIAHYSEVVRLAPRREAAWRHLGFKKVGGRWVKPDDLVAERQDAERQKHADRMWKPKLERIREGLDSRDSSRRARTAEAIAEVTDPAAVPMIWAVLIRGNERARLAAVRMLGQIDGPAASNALAALAIFNPLPEVRARALELLSRRDPRDVIGRLIGMIRKPFKYEVRRLNGPGSAGRLFLEGERYNVQRFYDDPAVNPAFLPPRLFAPSVPFNPFSVQNMILVSSMMNGMTISPGPSAASVQQTARTLAANPHNAAAILKNAQSAPSAPPTVASNMAYSLLAEAAYRDMQIASIYEAEAENTAIQQQRLARDIQAVQATNARINELNRRVLPVLGMITGQDLGAEPEKWKSWWTDQLGYVYESKIPEIKPTFTEAVDAPFTVGTTHTACFAAGTPVFTLAGPRAIESMQVGDQVLAQDPVTGQLRFRPVLAVHRNRSAATLRISVGNETVIATGIHRFWKAGKGWVMARDLKAGDHLRVVGGTVPVRSVEPGRSQSVYNLDVAEDYDFFVGTRRLLVHDFSFVHPVLTPFDREPDQPAPPARSRPASMLGPGRK